MRADHVMRRGAQEAYLLHDRIYTFVPYLVCTVQGTPPLTRLLGVFVGAATDDGDDVHPSPSRKRPRPDRSTQGECTTDETAVFFCVCVSCL